MPVPCPQRHLVTRARLLLPLMIILASCSNTGPTAPRPASPAGGLAPNAIVVRHVDGDTVIVRRGDDEQSVRLIGIDTPETKKPNTPIECFGPEASARLHDLLPDGSSVRLERDVEERDTYNRVLAYVYRSGDALFVNEAMATEGYANALTIRPNTAHADTIGAATDQARRERRGLWGSCTGPHVAATR